MHKPSIRRKHLKGLRNSERIRTGANFKGGNGQKPVLFVRQLEKILRPAGFVREYAIGIKGRKLRNYKVDFAHVEGKIAIECDGPAHRSHKSRELDRKKDMILRSFGWRIIRVRHA
jgi:hypothetical protein